MGNEKEVGVKVSVEKIVYHEKTPEEIKAIVDENNDRHTQEVLRKRAEYEQSLLDKK